MSSTFPEAKHTSASYMAIPTLTFHSTEEGDLQCNLALETQQGGR